MVNCNPLFELQYMCHKWFPEEGNVFFQTVGICCTNWPICSLPLQLLPPRKKHLYSDKSRKSKIWVDGARILNFTASTVRGDYVFLSKSAHKRNMLIGGKVGYKKYTIFFMGHLFTTQWALCALWNTITEKKPPAVLYFCQKPVFICVSLQIYHHHVTVSVLFSHPALQMCK